MSENETAADPADGFADLGLRPEILEALARLEHTSPTPIQAAAIPALLDGADVLGQAATGTGKTAAFALPILDRIGTGPAVPTALVLTPTRELAIQVNTAVRDYGQELGIASVAVYGGQPIQHQLRKLEKGCHVVVATPGRAIDHLKRGSLDLDTITTVVLDEADEMLDMGFAEELETLLDATPDERQTVLFSATLPKRITAIADRYQREPTRISVARDEAADASLVTQVAYLVRRQHKAAALARVLDMEQPTATLVFCRTRSDVDELTVTMNGRGHRAEALHGGMDQGQRDKVMARLRDGTAQLLVATDVAARGLDVDSLTHVVNYDLPTATESYIHRIGRVGRAGRTGVAITLADPRMKYRLDQISRTTGRPIEIAPVPSVEALRARQIEHTSTAVSEALAEGDLEDFAPVLHELAGAGSPRDIALAAIKLAHEALNRDIDDTVIPDGSAARGKDRPQRDRDSGKRTNFDDREGRAAIQINVGRSDGVRPGDLVGCIANETSLGGDEIGPITINDKSSVVGVPDAELDAVVAAIGSTTIRGRKAKARRFDERLAARGSGGRGNSGGKPKSGRRQPGKQHKPPYHSARAKSARKRDRS